MALRRKGCQGEASCCHSWGFRGLLQGKDSLRGPGGPMPPPSIAEEPGRLSCKEGVN